jgi:hypothetical protein
MAVNKGLRMDKGARVYAQTAVVEELKGRFPVSHMVIMNANHVSGNISLYDKK